MKAYPQELRSRVVAVVEQGELTIGDIAGVFSVGLTFVKKLLRLHRAGEDLGPRHGGGPTRLLQEPERAPAAGGSGQAARGDAGRNTNPAGDAREAGQPAHPVSRTASPGTATEKKSLVASGRVEKHRKKFRKLRRVLDLRKCILIDEMGSN